MSTDREQKLKDRARLLDGIWWLVWREEVSTLIVYSTFQDKPLFILGKDDAQKFIDELNAHNDKKPDPYDRISPLEMQDEGGFYCYRTMRTNARKLMNVEEMARDDRYHEYGHIFLHEIAALQHACANAEKEVFEKAKTAVSKLQEALEADMVHKVGKKDLEVLSSIIVDAGELKKKIKEIDTKALIILERWMA